MLYPVELQAPTLSGWRDSNPRHPAPKAGALPGCATPRIHRKGTENINIYLQIQTLMLTIKAVKVNAFTGLLLFCYPTPNYTNAETRMQILTDNLEKTIEQAYAQPNNEWKSDQKEAVNSAIKALDTGKLRLCTLENGHWKHHPWLQKAIICYLRMQATTQSRNDYLFYQDKVPSKFADVQSNPDFRIVPPSHVRFGAYIGPRCILMPCFVNLGAYVGSGTMLDTWCTIGSGAQIGEKCHISGSVGIGGVIEPPQARPTIIEDRCFIGARSEIAEGIHIKSGAVLAMGTFISQSTKIFDRTKHTISYGVIPENAVVVPGSIPSPDGSHSVQAAIIVKYADASTREKTSINELIRDLGTA